MLVKKLSEIGGSKGIIVDKPILEMLNITNDSLLFIRTDGKSLIITPITPDNLAELREETKPP